jgi:hypothetical protein
MSSPTASLFKKVYCLHFFPLLASIDTFVPTKIVQKRDFERDHLAEKSYWTKMGQKMHSAPWEKT